MNILEVNNLKRYYGSGNTLVRALDGVSFTMEKGEMTAVVGASGSGKSTLLNLIGALDSPTEGEILIQGRPLSQLNRKELSIFQTLMEAIREVGHLSRQKRIEIVLEEFTDVLVLQSRRWTREVFVNLLENALKYSPSGSAIQITVQPQVSYVAVSVKDRGIGIPKEDQRKIFKRFYRCENVQNEIGSGLGLYLVQLILLKENGNISVRSEVGKGSTFTVFLKMVNVEKESRSS